MERIRRIIAGVLERVRPTEVIRDYGASILLYTCLLVVAHVLRADFQLTDFRGRTISQATLDNISIARRTGLYTSSVLVFLSAGASLILVFAWLRRWIADGARMLLQASSMGGLVLLYLAAYKSFPIVSLQLLFVFQVLLALVSATEARLAERRLRADQVAYMAWLFASAVCAWFLALDFVVAKGWPAPTLFAPAVAVLGAALHLVVLAVRRAGSNARRNERVDAFLCASLPLFFLPAASVVSIELYMLANNREIGWANAAGPASMRSILWGLLLVWGIVRYRRALVRGRGASDYALGGLLAKVGFPVMLAGIISFRWYMPLMEPSTDFLEPANPGLLIQQWFEFGRWPFLETFNAHGLSDAVFGLVYAALTGFRDETWQFYDHAIPILNALVAYWILWKITESAYLAIFSVTCLPYLNALFPEYCVLALFTVWVLRWVLERSSARAWFVFFLYLAFCVLWRIDLGIANGVASIATLCAVRWMAATSRLPIAPMVRGAIAASITCAATVVLLGLAKGVDLVVLARDIGNILTSNQGFGYSRLAERRNDVFIWHHFLIPLLVFLTGCMVLSRWRGKLDPKQAAWPCLALCFMAAYYFVNVPRGLVRHVFLEGGNVYLSSFAFAIFSLAVYGLGSLTRAQSFGVFVLVSSSFAYNFSLDHPATKTADERENLCEELAQRLEHPPMIQPAPGLIDRSPIFAKFKEHQTGAILEFLARNLAPEQTFLDLSSSPMLYIFAHRRAPHYMNHLLLVDNDYLQERVIEDLAKHDAPLVLLKTEPSLARRDGAIDFGTLDGVPFEWRHYRIYEYVYEHYQPLCIVQRWHVWARKDWMQPAPPPVEQRTVCWSIASDHARAEDQDVGDAHRGTLEVRGIRGRSDAKSSCAPFALDPELACTLHVAGASPHGGFLDLEWSTRDEHGSRAEHRRIAWPAGAQDRHLVLPGSTAARWLDRFVCDASGVPDFSLATLELSRAVAPDCTALTKLVEASTSDELRGLPYVWGAFDERRAPFEVERVLLGDDRRGGEDVTDLALKHIPLVQWPNGVNKERGGALIEDLEVAQTIRRGDQLVFAAAGARDVIEVDGRRVWVSGAPLDPKRDGYPHRAIWHRAARTSVVLRVDEVGRYPFEKLDESVGGSYVVVKLKSLSSATRSVRIDYGEDLDARGRFVFSTLNDGAEHEYVIRASMQFHWASGSKNWLAIAPQGGAVELTSLFIARGD